MNINIQKRFSILAPVIILLVCLFALSCSDDKEEPRLAPASPGKYYLTFEADGGIPAPTRQLVDSGATAVEPPTPAKANYKFDGWFTDKNFTTRFSFDSAIKQNITLYAKWTALIVNKTIADIINAKKIPNDIAAYADPIAKDVISKYPVGAALVIKHLKPGGSGDGSSWSAAAGNLKTVIDGITDASPNKVYLVLLAIGEYKAGDSIRIQNKNNIAIAGGFLVSNADGQYASSPVDTTTLSGEDTYKIFSNKDVDASVLFYRLKIAHGKAFNGGGMYNENSSPRLINVRFALNTVDKPGNGGGMYNENSSPSLENVSFLYNSTIWGSGGGMYNNNNSSPNLKNVSFLYNYVVNGSGGGMYNRNSYPTLTDAHLDDNRSTSQDGGGIANYQSSPTLTNVTFNHNSARDGGGMANYQSSPTLTNVTFNRNSAREGGGIANYQSSPILTNVSFVDNNATSGGGIANGGVSSPILNNISFVDNNATAKGGAIYNYSKSSPLVVNGIFWGNTASSAGAQLYFDNDGGTVRMYNSVLQGGRAQISGDTASKILAYSGMVERDPLLSNIAHNGGFVSTIAIGANSSAINIGLYAKRSGTDFYFSTDKASWFTINDDGTTNDNVPLPANTEDLTATDARGYKRVDKPDAGALEAGANP